MELQEAKTLAKELEKKIMRYSDECEKISVTGIGDDCEIEVRPPMGERIILNSEKIFAFADWYDLSIYIEAKDGLPIVVIF